jgi:hypothetical protein
MKKTLALLAVVLSLGFIPPALAKAPVELSVKIINRENSSQSYAYATFYSNSNATAASQTSTGTAAAATFQVSGATLTLQLPDGRMAVVNCASKFSERFRGPIGNRRSCRVPLVDKIQAEFRGDKAKLIWAVSLDGKKKESETYKILAVIDKPNTHH